MYNTAKTPSKIKKYNIAARPAAGARTKMKHLAWSSYMQGPPRPSLFLQ
jgi:hypothetical protein